MRLLLLVHVAASCLFFGSIAVTLLWKVFAERTRNSKIIHHTLRCALITDKLVTLPTVVLVTVTGLALMVTQGWNITRHFWLQASITLWLTSALLAATYLVPTLKRLERMAWEDGSAELESPEYWPLTNRWNLVSGILITSPSLILVMMIFKP